MFGISLVFLRRNNEDSLFEMGWDSVVGIATRYGLDGPGIESLWKRVFLAPVQTGPGAHPASCTVDTGSFPGVNQLRCGVDNPPTSSAGAKERVELYLYSPSGPSWLVVGQNIVPLPLSCTTQDTHNNIQQGAFPYGWSV